MLRCAYRFIPILNKFIVKHGSRRIYNNFPKLIFTLNFGVLHALKNEEDSLNEQFEEEIKRATVEGEKYLAQLMRVLRTLILQTSIEYQECLIKQIELTAVNTKVGPVGTHWDVLTGFRVKGQELKEELTRYESLATSIADIINKQVAHSLGGNKIILKQLNAELDKLQKLCQEQLQEIHRYESQLLVANRDSILKDANVK